MEKKIMLSLNSLWEDAWKIELDEATKNGEIKLEDLRQSSRTTKANPDGENATWWYANGKKFLDNWITWRDNSNWKIWTTPDGKPGIEITMEVEIGGISFKGAVDRIFVTPDGELVILDLKTGQRTPQTDLQLQVYACLLERVYNVRPSWGCYWMARTGTTSNPVNLDKFTLKKLDEMVALFQKAREHDIYLPNFDGCKMCSLTDYCYWVNGEKHLPLGTLEISNVK
jgi:hypothetical protein